MATRVYVAELPDCNICKAQARYDGRMRNGQWAYMCDPCFAELGVGLGTGCGQELILQRD